MRLNTDCVRDLLLTIEDIQVLYNSGTVREINSNFLLTESALKGLYTSDDISYSIKQCSDNRLIDAQPVHTILGGGCYHIFDITPKGHEFLADIRNDTNWNKTKEVAKEIGSSSLKALVQIATGIVSELIKLKIGI